MENSDNELEFLPPPGPPPLLNLDQITHLAYQGWLPLELPPELRTQLERLSAGAESFFDRELDEKKALYPPSQGTECGFYHVPEEKEYLTFRYRLYDDSELDQQVAEAWPSAGLLLYKILCDLSRATFYDPTAWNALVQNALDLLPDRTGMKENISLMRLFRYYPSTGFAAEHVDVGLLTLCVGGGTGLQVWDHFNETPQWVDANGPVVLVGDTVRALLCNRVRAGRHRVVGNPHGRSSIVFALRPTLKGTIDLSKFGGDAVVDTREYFFNIKGSRYNINATKDIRDQQRRKQDEHRQQLQDVDTSSLPQGHG